jgi:hypothetical protein
MSSGYSPADAAASSAVATVLDGHDRVNALVSRCSDRARSPSCRAGSSPGPTPPRHRAAGLARLPDARAPRADALAGTMGRGDAARVARCKAYRGREAIFIDEPVVMTIQKARTTVVGWREGVLMTPYSIFAVGPNGNFVWAKEIMASSDAAALGRARQLLDQLDLGVWSGGREIGGLSARRRTPSLLTSWCAWIARASFFRLGRVDGVALTRPGSGRSLPP